MNPQQILDYLNGRDGATNAALVTTFRVDIDNREATVEISDHGVAAGEYRYSVVAELSEREADEIVAGFGIAVGNQFPTLEAALDDLDWWTLNARN